MTLALTVVYKCTSNCGKNKSSETVNRGVGLHSITAYPYLVWPYFNYAT